jgi:hypothetical protein
MVNDMNELTTMSAGALPATVQDLINQRRNPRSVSLSDRVEGIYLRLYENPVFKQYRQALYKEQCTEGTFIDDDVMAAQMIKEAAGKAGAPTHDPILAKEKLSVLRRLLGVVERRYNADRQSRRNIEESGAPRQSHEDDSDEG